MYHPYEFMENIHGASSPDALAAVAAQHFNTLGFEKFAYVIVDLPHNASLNKSYVSNYPAEWAARYMARDYFSLDPVFDLARARKKSFVWGSDETIVPITAEQKQFFQEAGDVGTSNGLSVPVLLPKGGFCLLSLCSDSMNQKGLERYLQHVEPELVTAALLLHQGVTTLPENVPVICPYELTELERETLYWLCQNKTYGDIGELLGLGREGVSERLRKIYRKMHAVGKVDAVKKAIQFGLFKLQ